MLVRCISSFILNCSRVGCRILHPRNKGIVCNINEMLNKTNRRVTWYQNESLIDICLASINDNPATHQA
jgi:hypothetical protein